jgi:hypothetical protein
MAENPDSIAPDRPNPPIPGTLNLGGMKNRPLNVLRSTERHVVSWTRGTAP